MIEVEKKVMTTRTFANSERFSMQMWTGKEGLWRLDEKCADSIGSSGKPGCGCAIVKL